MKSVDYWCNEAVRLANPPPDANWASMKNPMAWLIEQIQKDAAQVRAARDEEIARLKEALKRMAGNIAASSSIVPSDAIPLIEIARAALNGEKELS